MYNKNLEKLLAKVLVIVRSQLHTIAAQMYFSCKPSKPPVSSQRFVIILGGRGGRGLREIDTFGFRRFYLDGCSGKQGTIQYSTAPNSIRPRSEEAGRIHPTFVYYA